MGLRGTALRRNLKRARTMLCFWKKILGGAKRVYLSAANEPRSPLASLTVQQTSRGPFSAVSTATIAREGSFFRTQFRIRQMNFQKFADFCVMILQIFAEFSDFCKFLRIFQQIDYFSPQFHGILPEVREIPEKIINNCWNLQKILEILRHSDKF